LKKETPKYHWRAEILSYVSASKKKQNRRITAFTSTRHQGSKRNCS